MQDHRDAIKTLIALDVLGQHVAIHLRHFRIGQNHLKLVAQIHPGALHYVRHRLEPFPCLVAIGCLNVFDTHLVQHFGDFTARHHRIISKKYA